MTNATDVSDLDETPDLDELRALRKQEAGKYDDSEARIAKLDGELEVHREQQAAERDDAEAQIARLDGELAAHREQQGADRAEARRQGADAALAIAQHDQRIRTREAAAGATGRLEEVGIFAPAPAHGGKFCNSPHPTGGNLVQAPGRP
jgi:hypothetical protein